MNVSVSDFAALWGEMTHQQLETVANGSGVPVGTVIRVVKGRTKNPRVSTFLRLAAEYERQTSQNQGAS